MLYKYSDKLSACLWSLDAAVVDMDLSGLKNAKGLVIRNQCEPETVESLHSPSYC